MQRRIRKVAVIGSGIMGGGIAALLASAGADVLLLDIVPFDLKDEEKSNPAARNRIVKAGFDAALKSRPPLFMDKADAAQVAIGNLEDDFDKLADATGSWKWWWKISRSSRNCSNGSTRSESPVP
jgi:3-hydroxyacyl-CoA dehydrogenase